MTRGLFSGIEELLHACEEFQLEMNNAESKRNFQRLSNIIDRSQYAVTRQSIEVTTIAWVTRTTWEVWEVGGVVLICFALLWWLGCVGTGRATKRKKIEGKGNADEKALRSDRDLTVNSGNGLLRKRRSKSKKKRR